MDKLKKLGIMLIALGGVIGIVVGAHEEIFPKKEESDG